MGTTIEKLQETLDSRLACKEALSRKRGKDVGDVFSTYASEIDAIEPLLDTITITKNGTYDVKNYKNSKVLVENDTDIILKNLIEGTSTSFEIPASVTKIGDYFLYQKNVILTFADKNSIQNVGNQCFYRTQYSSNNILDLPNCTTIGKYSFYYMGFSSINLPKCTSIGDSALSGTSGSSNPSDLTLDLPNCTTIGQNACRYMTGSVLNNYMLTVNLPKCTSIGTRAFTYNNIASIYAPLLEKIPDEILYCQSAKPLSQEVFYVSSFFPIATSIGNSSFRNQTNFKEVYINDTCTTIGNYAFANCSNLEKLVLNNNLTTIGSYIILQTSITSIEIPASVTKIGDTLHNNSSPIIYKFLSETPCTINSYTFVAHYIDKIYVPKGTSAVYKNATNWSKFADYIFEATNVILNIPSELLNNESIEYSLDNGATYQQFTIGTQILNEVSILKIKSTDSTQRIIIGTTSGGSDLGTISNSEITLSFTADTTIYLTIQ